VALCAVVVSVVLGAGGPASASPAAPPTAPDVMPKGAQIVHPAPPSPPACQNPTASFPPPATMPTPGAMPTGSYMAQIKARGYLRVGVDQNTYLWGYRDPSTGLLTGFDVSMLQQVSLAIFGPTGLSHIQYVVVPNKSRIPEVQSGRVDILAETMTINCEREKKIDFSTVYYEAGQKILVSTNSKITGPQDLGGKRVCATTGSTSLRNLVASGMPRDIQLWAVNNETDCLVMLQQGQVDAISTDDAILLGLAAQDPNTRVVPPTAFSQEPYGLAISKAHPGFTSFVNGVLAQVRADGAWTQIYDANLEPYTKDPVVPAPPMPSYR
jgi:polar amino acid transport system substrate-binding protein